MSHVSSRAWAPFTSVVSILHLLAPHLCEVRCGLERCVRRSSGILESLLCRCQFQLRCPSVLNTASQYALQRFAYYREENFVHTEGSTNVPPDLASQKHQHALLMCHLSRELTS